MDLPPMSLACTASRLRCQNASSHKLERIASKDDRVLLIHVWACALGPHKFAQQPLIAANHRRPRQACICYRPRSSGAHVRTQSRAAGEPGEKPSQPVRLLSFDQKTVDAVPDNAGNIADVGSGY